MNRNSNFGVRRYSDSGCFGPEGSHNPQNNWSLLIFSIRSCISNRYTSNVNTPQGRNLVPLLPRLEMAETSFLPRLEPFLDEIGPFASAGTQNLGWDFPKITPLTPPREKNFLGVTRTYCMKQPCLRCRRTCSQPGHWTGEKHEQPSRYSRRANEKQVRIWRKLREHWIDFSWFWFNQPGLR